MLISLSFSKKVVCVCVPNNQNCKKLNDDYLQSACMIYQLLDRTNRQQKCRTIINGMRQDENQFCTLRMCVWVGGMSKVLSFLSGPFFDNHTIVYPQLLLLLLNLQVLKSLPSIYQSRKTSSWQHLVNVLYLCIVLCVVHYCIRHHYIDNDIVRPSGQCYTCIVFYVCYVGITLLTLLVFFCLASGCLEFLSLRRRTFQYLILFCLFELSHHLHQ